MLDWLVCTWPLSRWTITFHTVVPGELYRSAQPTAALIAEYREGYAIKTIINLRGDNTGSGWYDSEVAEARNLGIAHVDFRMSARREMTTAQFNQLMDVFQKAEKPILVHCNSGADRSGLVSALYVAGIAKLGEEAAESQISFRYGHIRTADQFGLCHGSQFRGVRSGAWISELLSGRS